MNARQYLAPPRIKKSTAMGQTTSSEPVFFIEPYQKFPIYKTTKGIANHTAVGPLFFDYECDGCGGSYSCPHYYFKEENRTWILHAVLPKASNTIFYCHGDEKFQAVLNAYATALEGVSFAITFESDHEAGQKLFCETVKKYRNIHELVICSGEISNDGELSKAILSMPSLIRVDCRIQNFTEQDLQLLPAILNNNHVERFSMTSMPLPPTLWSSFCSAWKNTDVQELSLNCVPEPATLWSSFCSALASNTSLKKITLTPSNKTDLSPIATILESNKTLKELNVQMIHPNGCEEVLKSMKNNTTLETLSIALNVESDYKLFKEMIKINKTLKNLTVSCYHWQCMDIFWDGISQNNGLVTLHLKYIYDINKTMGKLCVAALKNVGIKKMLVNDAPVTIRELRKEFAQYKMNIAIISRHVYLPKEIWTQIIKNMNVLSALNEDLMVRTIKYTKANFGLQAYNIPRSSEPVFFIEPKFPIYTTTKGIVDKSTSGPLFYEYECDGCGGSYSCPHYYFKEENRTWILHAVLPNGVNMVVYCHGDKEFQNILEKYSGKLEGVPFAITFEEYHTSGQKLFCKVVQNHQNIHELAIGHGDYYDIPKVIESMPALKKVDCLIRNFNKPEVQPVLEILKNEHIEEFIMHHFPNSAFWSHFCSALASSKTLKKFSLLSAPTTFDLSQIGSVLESNATLNELNIMMFYPNYITGTDAVLRSLKSNSSEK